MNKAEIRKLYKAKRDKLPQEMRDEFSHIIQKKVLNLPQVKSAKNIMIYMAFGSEVKTDLLIKNLSNVCIPKVDGKTMYAQRYTGDLVRNNYGILEERRGVIINDIDLAVVPLVAFDKNLSRIGYGGGYYDRFLSGRDIIKIGIAFSAQECEKIENEKTDIKLDIIITEKQIWKK